MRTSDTDCLQIAAIRIPGQSGVIGVTLCPGKKDASASWDRDLDTDLAAIGQWGAEVVVTLVEDHELLLLRVTALGEAVARHEMLWFHLPIRDVSVPDRRFEQQWAADGADLRRRLGRGAKILVHCRGGLGRSGTIAARLLVEFGVAPDEAINVVRSARPGAIETAEQEAHVRNCLPVIDPEDV